MTEILFYLFFIHPPTLALFVDSTTQDGALTSVRYRLLGFGGAFFILLGICFYCFFV